MSTIRTGVDELVRARFVNPERRVELRRSFATAEPFPHVVIDDFADANLCRRIAGEEYRDVGTERWTYHRHYSQATYSRTDAGGYGAAARALIADLKSPAFVSFLAEITGIAGLIPDPSLEDGGLTACRRGGFAFVHTDLTVHRDHRRWQRRLNLLLYLNEGWRAEYEGALELWDQDVRHCVRRVEPLFNRCLIFRVGMDALHGYPEPLRCPDDAPRKCLALYYFTAEAAPPPYRNFTYHARPGEGLRHLAVAVDNRLLRIYERLRRPLGIDDRHINRLMRLATRILPHRR